MRIWDVMAGARWILRLGAVALLALAAGCAKTTPEEEYEAGVAALREGRHARGQAHLLAALKLDPDVPFAADAYNWLGLASVELGKPREAAAYFERAQKLAPAWVEPTYNLGCLVLESGDVQRGVALLRKAADANPRDVRALMQIGEWTTRNGRWPLAKRMYQELLRREAAAATAYAGLGRVAFLEGDLAEAESFFRRALEANPAHAPALYNMGVLLSRSEGRMGEAVEYFGRYLAAEPDGARSEAARRRVAEGQAALAQMGTAAQERAQAAERHLKAGQNWLTQGRPQEAHAALLRAQAAEPDNPAVLAGLARSSVAVGEYDTAVLSLRRLLQLDPNNAAALWTLAVLFGDRLEMPARSVALYREFAKRFPGDRRAAEVPARIRALEGGAGRNAPGGAQP